MYISQKNTMIDIDDKGREFIVTELISETTTDKTVRFPVPGGWVCQTTTLLGHTSQCFVPDKDHNWILDKTIIRNKIQAVRDKQENNEHNNIRKQQNKLHKAAIDKQAKQQELNKKSKRESISR